MSKNPGNLKILGTSLRAKIKTLNKDGATYSNNVCARRSVVCYRCCIATAEWHSSAVENTADKAQCCNPGRFVAKAKIFYPKFEAKEAEIFKPKKAKLLAQTWSNGLVVEKHLDRSST